MSPACGCLWRWSFQRSCVWGRRQQRSGHFQTDFRLCYWILTPVVLQTQCKAERCERPCTLSLGLRLELCESHFFVEWIGLGCSVGVAGGALRHGHHGCLPLRPQLQPTGEKALTLKVETSDIFEVSGGGGGGALNEESEERRVGAAADSTGCRQPCLFLQHNCQSPNWMDIGRW